MCTILNSHEKIYECLRRFSVAVYAYAVAQTYHGNFVPVFSVILALSEESVALWGRQTHKAAITHDQMGFSSQLFVEHARMSVSWQVSIKLAGSAACVGACIDSLNAADLRFCWWLSGSRRFL